MNDKQYTTEQLSFWQLLSKTEKIEIPIIQRDYAQGRDDKAKIRDPLLKAFENALENNPIELDFIYGNVKDGCLQPLDGQQRLTTLFLLHWYIATKENKISDDVKNNLKKFTYETRTSSRDFCNRLVEKGGEIKSEIKKISETIEDASWFVKTWKNDPTISAMLIMLDAIHSRFNLKENLWERIISSEDRPIIFQYIELENLELSDDLYIKMNARGKQLTAFENFKASIEKKIDDEKWDEGKDITETFSHKADTSWTDLFWQNSADKSFDEAYINFFANSTMTYLALDKSESNDKKREKLIQELFNNPENLLAEHLDKNSYDYLCKNLNIYSKYSDCSLEFSFPFWRLKEPERSLFSIITITKDKKPTYSQKVLFYAQTEYLLKTANFNKEPFNNWMRVVRNIVQNSTIDSTDTFIGAIHLISELSDGCNDIYNFLSETTIKSGFAASQIREEKIKARLIQKDGFIKAIFETEDTNFCKGRISFALYCTEDNNIVEKTMPEQLSAIKDLFVQHLNNEDISNYFRQALLTIGDGNFYNYWGSWLYAVESPKRRLIEDIEDLKEFAYNTNKNENKEYREYLKDLLNQLTLKTLDELIDKFIPPENMPNWKKRLIREKGLLYYSAKHFIAIKEDNSCCYLLPQSKVANNYEGRSKCKEIR